MVPLTKARSTGAPVDVSNLYCGGVMLDTSPEKFGELRDSSGIIDDIPACKARMEEEGYLLLRGLIDRDAVLEARREIMLKYATIGEIDSINHPVMEGIQQEETFTAHQSSDGEGHSSVECEGETAPTGVAWKGELVPIDTAEQGSDC